MFPEGHSHLDAELKAIRRGAASITLGGEVGAGFELGLRVVPLGLHYEPKQQFDGEVHVRVGESFGIRDLADVPREEALRTIQDRIAASLRPLVLHLDRVDLEPLVRGVAEVYDEHQRASAGRLEPRSKVDVVRMSAACLNHFLAADPSAVDRTRRYLRQVQRLERRAGIHGEAVEVRSRPIRSLLAFGGTLLLVVLGFPAYLLGILTGYLPYRLTDTVARAVAKRRKKTTLPRLRIVTGAVVFPVTWGVMTLCVWLWSRSPGFTLFSLVAIVASGLFARIYAERVRFRWVRLAGLLPIRKPGMRRVAHARRRLLELVDELVQRYRTETGIRLLPPRRTSWTSRVPWRRTAAIILTGLIVWFAFGFRDARLRELPDRPSPWATLDTARATTTLERDAQELVSLLDTLDRLETGMYELKKGFDAGERDFTDVADDRAIRRALLTYLSCRSALFRLAWFYRAPDRPDESELSVRAFVLGYTAGLELCRRGLQLVSVFDGCPNAIRKLNEGDAAWSLPAKTYDRVRQNLASTDVYDELAVATARYERLGTEQPRPTREPWVRIWNEADEGRAVVKKLSDERWTLKWDAAVARAEGTAEEARYAANKLVAGLIGGVRIREGELSEGLISDAQVEWLREEHLEPGDILLERRNWALSNVFLPGFWTHAAVYVGGLDGVRALGIQDDERVQPVLEALARPDEHGATPRIVEALAPGVILSSLEESVGSADAVCVLRPKLEPDVLADAVAHALKHHGKPYDFDFDFFSSDRLVCTELVYRAFQGPIDFELQHILGRRTLPALGILRKWAAERTHPEAQLELVCFLDSDEAAGVARPGTETELLGTLDRPALTVLQAHGGSSRMPLAALVTLAVLFLAALLFLRRR